MFRFSHGGSAAIRAADAAALVVDFGMQSPAYGLAISRDVYEKTGDVAAAIDWLTRYFAQRGAGYLQSAGFSIPTNEQELVALPYSPEADNVWNIMMQHFLYLDSVDVYQLHYYESWTLLPEVLDWIRARMGETGIVKPIEAWELGYAFYDQALYDADAHGRDVLKLIATAYGEGLRRVHYLPYLNVGVAQGKPETHWGLVDSNDNGRPALMSFQNAITYSSGVSSATRIYPGIGEWGYRFDGLEITWTEQGDPVVTFP